MPRPTPPVKRVCYADDITVWATGPNIPQLESMINNYLRDVSIYLKDNSLLISAPKSTVTLFTPDKHQFQMHPDIILEDTQLPLERSPKILGVIMDPSLSFHKHCGYVSDRIDKRNNMLKALAGSSWGQDSSRGVVASAPDFERADEGSILTAGLCFKSGKSECNNSGYKLTGLTWWP